jgi:2-polyprenyl-3-methyl-5-hydroxy-6-metoxy-1,4-benzoquinol methylase
MLKWSLRKKVEDKKDTQIQKRAGATTDHAWEEWGRRDPYFGALTHTKYRIGQMTPDDKQDFFESGRLHVAFLMRIIHQYVDPVFSPKTVLDFGCGAGRTLVSFAIAAQHATGADVSKGMLEEAGRNCDERHLSNVSLIATDDSLSALTQSFDLIHSFIVLQHIPVERGYTILRNLLARLNPGGVGALQFYYFKRPVAITQTAIPVALPAELRPVVTVLESDPEMQMNIYPMNDVLALLQEFKIERVHLEYTDHGGELGVFLFFSASSAARYF